MTRLEHSTLIDRPLADVYALARQVERYPDFLPGYRVSRIVETQGERSLLEREAVVRGKRYRWTSWVRFEPNREIYFEQAEGPLRGMRVMWRFVSVTPVETRLIITHQFRLRRPWLVGFLMETFVFKPRIDEIASQVVRAFKAACEKEEREVVRV